MGEREALVVVSSSEVEVVEAGLSSSSVAFWAWVVEEPHVEVVVVIFDIFGLPSPQRYETIGRSLKRSP